MTFKEKFDIINNNVKLSAERSGRKRGDITVLAVTKTVPPARIIEAAEAGFTRIGENYAQEFTEKYEILRPYIDEFHFIGHLQSNKVKYVAGKARLIHSADSAGLIKEINNRAAKNGICQNVLIEVNLVKEASKSGVYAEDLERLLYGCAEFQNVAVKGLMTLPPADAGETELRRVFSRMKGIFDGFRNFGGNVSMEFLSMGMSKDHIAAIEEGSNLIRLGTTIFGERE